MELTLKINNEPPTKIEYRLGKKGEISLVSGSSYPLILLDDSIYPVIVLIEKGKMSNKSMDDLKRYLQVSERETVQFPSVFRED